MECDPDLVCCPICSREFPASSIETHAAKCLFLNESTSDNSITPRLLNNKNSPVNKKSSKQRIFKASPIISSQQSSVNNSVKNDPQNLVRIFIFL